MVTTAVVLISGTPSAGNAANGRGPVEAWPPALAPVGNRPLLCHILDSLERAGIEDALLAADGPLAPTVKAIASAATHERLRVTDVGLDEPTIAGALDEVERLHGPTPVLVHFGDSLAHDFAHDIRAATPREHDALLLVQERGDSTGEVQSLNGHLASHAAHGRAGTSWSPAGVAVLGSGAGAAARSLGAAGTNHDMELVALAQRLASDHGHLEARSVGDWLRLHGEQGGLLEANRFVLEGQPRDVPPEVLSGASDAQGSVIVHRTAQLESAIVRGPAVIGAGARLTDAYVGPYSSIGDGVLIDGAEVENSIVLPGAHICHLGDRLEGSVIGANARIFRDFKLPNALRLSVGEGAVVSVH